MANKWSSYGLLSLMLTAFIAFTAFAGFAAVLAGTATAAPTALPAAGSVDTTFGNGGSATVSVGTLAAGAAVAVQPDGKIVTAGAATIGGQSVILSTRMTSSGALDPSYGADGIVTVNINGAASVDSGAALALAPDGKIVIAGGARSSTYGPLAFAAVRLDTDGTLDPTFGHDGIATMAIGSSAIATAVVIQPDGKIALAGTALVGHNEFAAARLNADGTPDLSFGTNGTTTLSPAAGAWGMVLQSDGKLVLAGQAPVSQAPVSQPTSSSQTPAQQFMAARLNANGTLDPSFGQAGIKTIPIGATALGYGIALQPDGKLVLAGPAFTTTGVAATVRLNSDGSLDQSYGSGGIATFPDWYGVNGITIDAAGEIVLPAVGLSAVRLNANGSPDLTFGSGGSALVKLGTAGAANGAAIQASDGKVVLVGATTINGQTMLVVTRLNGQPADTSTSPGSSGTPAKPSPVAAPTVAAHSAPVVSHAVKRVVARRGCRRVVLAKQQHSRKRAHRSTHRRTHHSRQRRPAHRSTTKSGVRCKPAPRHE